ncbi:MAG: carboxypeptidase regulatory-like domain-containing protein [Planctomycetota bacterium]|jgi:beta-lactamase regulating signal transducer with metallopeptidase domain/protocatechuate 3,4-dioxygenase beta subunit/RNase P subunit RPR2
MVSKILHGGFVLGVSAVWLPVLLDAGLKGVLVLGLAAAAVLGMRRASAAARHLMWLLAIVSLAALPLLSAALPGWHVLPDWMTPSVDVETGPATADALRPAPDAAQPAVALTDAPKARAPDISTTLPTLPVAVGPQVEPALVPPMPVSPAAREAVAPAQTPAWCAWALSVWSVGAVFALMPWVFGRLSLGRVERGAARVADGPLASLVRKLAAGMGVRRRVWLLLSHRRSMPMHWGILRPRILLAASAKGWSAERVRLVLLHELAHVKRGDCLAQFVTQLVCALYWFNPLVWVARRRVQLESEAACDDLTVRSGFRPSDYAQHLLEIASGLEVDALPAQAALAMAQPSRLEGRLVAILDSKRNRRRLTRPGVVAALVGLAAVVVPLAMLSAAADAHLSSAASGQTEGAVDEERPAEATDSAKAPAGNDVSVRYAQAVARVAEAEYAQALEADKRVPGSVPEAELKRLMAAARKAQLQLAQASQGRTGQAERKESRRPDLTGVEFRGRVVDDETGHPVERFGWQWGWPPSDDSPEMGWGGITRGSSRRRDGRFQTKVGWPDGKRANLRILADGYVPQPVVPKPVAAPAQLLDLVVRLKRGPEIRGRVLDHAGAPVAGAKVFLGGAQSVRLADGEVEHFSGSQAETDEQGRFAIRGAGEGTRGIVISAPKLHVWKAPLPQPGQEATIKLPEPASLTIHYDVEGGEDEAEFRLELKTWELEDWRGVAGSVQKRYVPNRGKVVMRNLAPGTYDLVRTKRVDIGDLGKGMFCFRCDVTVAPGQAAEVRLVRKEGRRISGMVVKPEVGNLAGAFVYVKPAEATGDPRRLTAEVRLDTFDMLGCKINGQFQTEIIPPGEYTVVAEAYKPEDLKDGWTSGRRLPDFVGTAKVTVKKEGPLPAVLIELKTWQETKPPPEEKSPPPKEKSGSKAEGTDDVSVGYAQALEANKRVPGTVPEAESERPMAAARKAQLQLAQASQAREGRAERRESESPDTMQVEFRGRVVDDETGQPVERFGWEWGWPTSDDSPEMGWGGITSGSSRRRDGKFQSRVGRPDGKRVNLRILADGYVPQPVVPKPVVVPAQLLDLVVRLKRGPEIRGRVLDHTGAPVAGAKVFLSGVRRVSLADGEVERYSGSQAETDDQGRFAIRGAGEGTRGIVVSAPKLHVWKAPLPKPGQEATIKLPEPASLTIHYDIEGGEDEATFRLELKTWELEDWRGVARSVQRRHVPNRGKVVMRNLAPGTYDLGRMKSVQIGHLGQGHYCFRCDVTVGPGQAAEVRLVRKEGRRISGMVVKPDVGNLAGAFVYVKPAEATGDPRRFTAEVRLDTFDFLGCKINDQFQTEIIPPGEYTVVVEAYKPEDRNGVMTTGMQSPDFVGTAKVTVNKEGPPPAVLIELKTWRETKPPDEEESGSKVKGTGDVSVRYAQALEANRRVPGTAPEAELKAQLQLAQAGQAERKESRRPDLAGVEFRGRVVDDETGQPVERFGWEWGWPTSDDSPEMGWGGITSGSSRRRDGKFQARVGRPDGKRVNLRILADGYVPQPVVPKPVVAPAQLLDLVVRLKRGPEIRGRVLDHTGAPVAGAKVFLGGDQSVELEDGEVERYSGSQAETDEQGRFAIRGAGEGTRGIVVSAPKLHVWKAPLPQPGQEATIKLPEPASLTIHYDVEGGEDEAKFRLELKTWELEDWKGLAQSVHQRHVPNRGKVVMRNLAPGIYDLARWKSARISAFGKDLPCFRCDVTLEPGQAAEVRLVRKEGRRISGMVVKQDVGDLARALVYVKPAEATGDPRARDEWKLETFDFLGCKINEQFQTEMVPPGEYTVVAEAYKPEDRNTGIPVPDFVGTAKVTVKKEGPPPVVLIELKTWRETKPPPEEKSG